MTKQEYVEYQKAVEDFFKAEGITNLTNGGVFDATTNECESCGEIINDDEGYFSRHSCDCCRTRLGGQRYHASGWNPKHKTVFCYEVCRNCLYYAEYGRLDDQAMLELEQAP